MENKLDDNTLDLIHSLKSKSIGLLIFQIFLFSILGLILYFQINGFHKITENWIKILAILNCLVLSYCIIKNFKVICNLIYNLCICKFILEVTKK